jgi:indole-3-glycerol phosphate synthase
LSASDDILSRIVAHKREEIAAAKVRRPVSQMQDEAADAPPVRDFVAALRNASPIGLIAEVKKASPSAGIIRPDFDPLAIAQEYAAAGANCLSVLTDEQFFLGHLDFLRSIRQAVSVPVMRKDFLIDRYQILEARAAGADCVLLIAECLDDCQLRDLYFYASELGMDALIELYDPENLDRVLKLEPPLVGINNRDLRSFVVDLNHTVRLAPRIVPQALLVAESGIKTSADVAHLRDHGVGAILVGETLMRSPDIAAAVRKLMTV